MKPLRHSEISDQELRQLYTQSQARTRKKLPNFQDLEVLVARYEARVRHLEDFHYPKAFYRTAKGSYEVALSSYIRSRRLEDLVDLEQHELDYAHGLYFYLRSLEETLKLDPISLDHFKAQEHHYYARAHYTNIYRRYRLWISSFQETIQKLVERVSLEEDRVAPLLQVLERIDSQVSGPIFSELALIDLPGQFGKYASNPKISELLKQLPKWVDDFNHALRQALKGLESERRKEVQVFIVEHFEDFYHFNRNYLPDHFARPPFTRDQFEKMLGLEVGKGTLSGLESPPASPRWEALREWFDRPENYTMPPPIQRQIGLKQPFDALYVALFTKLSDRDVLVSLLKELHETVLAHALRYGTSHNEALEAILLEGEQREGFSKDIFKMRDNVSSEEWHKLLSDRRPIKDLFFDYGGSHGNNTHRLQVYFLIMLKNRHPEMFRLSSGQVSVSDLYAAMAKPEYFQVYDLERPTYELFFDIYFENNIQSARFLTRIRNLFGLFRWD